jgi:hypothetical protein
MRNLGGHRLCDNTPSYRLDIHVFRSDVPDAHPDPDFDKYFASSGFSRVHQLEEVNAFVSDSDDMFFDGIDDIDPRVMSMFDLHVPDSAPTHYDDLSALDHQAKAISAASRASTSFHRHLASVW